VICWHSLFGKLKVDGGAEFKGFIIKELQKLGICKIIISAYNAKANRIVERRY